MGPGAKHDKHGSQAAGGDEDQISTGQRKVAPASVHVSEEPANDGSTAFVRLDDIPAAPSPAAAAEPANDGATAFVRLDQVAPSGKAPAGPPARLPRMGDRAKQPLAPRKGLQVTLPDDEPTPPPPPKRVIAQPPADAKKGRRGAWWDEESPKDGDPVEPAPTMQDPPREEPPEEATSADLPAVEGENDGATAMFQTRKEPAGEEVGATAFVKTPVRKKAPTAEPEVAAYKPVQASDYRGHETGGPPKWRVWLQRAVIASVIIGVLGLASLIGAYVYFSREIPTFDSVADYKPSVVTRVVTSDGTVVGQYFKERRTVVKMDQIPRVLINAVISAEDKDFYKHPGFNLIALARAVVVDALSGRKRLGASTITQQVVKNFFVGDKKHLSRKMKELLLAVRLERNLSKDDILYLYLNHINFGKAHYGVEEAALYYFNKHVQDIELGEAAILAGLPQNPARINPRRHPDRAKARQKYVLDRMLSNKYISQEDHDREVEKPIVLPLPPPEPAGAWYVQDVRRQLLPGDPKDPGYRQPGIPQYDPGVLDTTGMTIELAMDAKLQDAAEVAVQEGLRAVDKRQGWRGGEFKIDADKIADVRKALVRKLDAVALSPDAVQIIDLEAIPEKEQLGPEAIARAAKVVPLEPGGIYAGIVTEVVRNEATIELAPKVSGYVLFSTVGWAREFKPEHSTPAPHTLSQVLSVGDVVPVRVTRLQTTHDSANHLKVARMELGLEQTPAVQGAFVGIDLKTRGVLALVGGYDAATSAFNRATQARRQPGSSFKPFVYAAALESGKYTPITKMDDSPEVIPDPWTGKEWKPQNFEKDEFAGPITLREALAQSKNTVAVKLLVALGIDKVRAQARAAGITSEIPQSNTAALGTGEVGVLEEVNAYATIASLGRKSDPVFIKKIVSRDGNTIFSAKEEGDQSMRADTAFLTAQLMRSVIESAEGTAHSLMALGRPVSGKTGTASDHKDGWFIGFTPSLVAGGWVGFDQSRPMGSLETGGHLVGPIWLQWMRAATKGTPPDEWPQPPPGVVAVKVNRNTGALARENDPYAVREFFVSGTEPASGQEEQQDPGQQEYYQEPQQ